MTVKKTSVSFKDNELETKLYKHMMKESRLKGPSTYIKELILKDMEEKAANK